MSQAAESDLKDRLERVEYDTISGDTVRAEVVDYGTAQSERRSLGHGKRVVTHDGAIDVEFELPSGRTVRRRFDTPQTTSERYEFVRFLRTVGLTLGTVDDLEGTRVELTITDDGDFELDIPEYTPPVRDRAKAVGGALTQTHFNRIATVMFYLTWPISGYRRFPVWHEKKWGHEPDPADWMFYLFYAVCWFCVVGTILLGVAIAGGAL